MYINSDNNGRGFLNAGGSHTLERFLNEVARDIEDPETGLSVWKRLQLKRIAEGSGIGVMGCVPRIVGCETSTLSTARFPASGLPASTTSISASVGKSLHAVCCPVRCRSVSR